MRTQRLDTATKTISVRDVPIPEPGPGMPMQQAAILADAVATPYGAVVNTGRVQVGESLVRPGDDVD